MGNRAVIAFSEDQHSVGIYLHWNGGRASVQGFLDAAKQLGILNPHADCYGVARLSQLIGNFFKGTLSLGVDTLAHLDCDNGDNGLYLVGPDWSITGRRYFDGNEEINADKTAAICAECVAAFPKEQGAA